MAGFPAVIGIEGAGVIEAAGSQVPGLKAGDRVVFGGGGPGTYSQASVRGAGAASAKVEFCARRAPELFFCICF